MAWDDLQTSTSIISATEWNNMVTDQKTRITDLVSDTTPQLGGNLDLNSKGFILASQTVSSTVSTGDLVMFDGTEWIQADASASSTCDSLLGISLGSSSVLTEGVHTTTGLTAGNIYYVSETAGAYTGTAPSTSGAIVRIVGYALSTTLLKVMFDGTYVENV